MGTAVFGAPEWRARSGRTIKPLEDGTITFKGSHGYLAPLTAMDAEEFFQAKRDDELGRWRWPENPDYVVMDDGLNFVKILHEPSMETTTWERGWKNTRSVADEAGVAYFEAHPERKPWQEAKPGETWRLTVTDRNPDDFDLTFNVIGVEGYIDARFARAQVSGQQMEYPVDSPAIVAGRRIWPEDAS